MSLIDCAVYYYKFDTTCDKQTLYEARHHELIWREITTAMHPVRSLIRGKMVNFRFDEVD